VILLPAALPAPTVVHSCPCHRVPSWEQLADRTSRLDGRLLGNLMLVGRSRADRPIVLPASNRRRVAPHRSAEAKQHCPISSTVGAPLTMPPGQIADNQLDSNGNQQQEPFDPQRKSSRSATAQTRMSIAAGFSLSPCRKPSAASRLTPARLPRFLKILALRADDQH
jgi:hypothetical protein